jgi:nitrate reductase gamma subunit
MLILLIGIGVSGLLMSFVTRADVVAVKNFFTGLMGFSINTLPRDFVLYFHLISVAALMAIFPISKLLHAPGMFFSPSRNQADNPREKRHIAPWAAELEK